MVSFQLHRFADTPFGVFGRLEGTNGFDCYTIERPWLTNTPKVSCIPAGLYPLTRRFFNKGGYEALEVGSVVARNDILIHVANTMNDVEGCIGVGSMLGFVNSMWAVVNSKATFTRLMEGLPVDEELELRVVWRYPRAVEGR